MEKIDLTKCNNLRYKAKINGNDDYGRICVENADTGLAFLRSDREDCYVATWHCDCPGVEGYSGRKVTDFEIVPRDPETYQDWQVGDIAYAEKHRNTRYEVIFRSGELVFFKNWENYATNPFTCSEAFRRFGFRLDLTDIELQIFDERERAKLRAVKSEIKSEIRSDSTHEFKKGEPVLVRDSSNIIWKLMAFVEVNEDCHYPYWGENGSIRGMYRHCIPYNERTMHLLGTAEDYKEEQS